MEQQGYVNNLINFYSNWENLIDVKQFNAALYMRLSKDDGQSYDSSSIETQRLMLTKYVQDYGFKVYSEYVDDGYTGLNFDRPDFQRMLKDIEAGKVNLVITKDLSRFGRDYIKTGDFIENYFAERNVRYIAVYDGVDTARPDSSDSMPYRNISNNQYARDISRKVKYAKRQRASHGMFINPQAPYGYRKHPENKNKLIIDEEAATVVKLIFQLALEGKGKYAIANILTERKIQIPSARKTAQGHKGFAHFNKRKKADFDTTWNGSTISSILYDQVYVGDIVNHKFEKLNYKSKKLTRMPKEKHIVVKNKHEPIISREDFDRVKELVTARHRPQIHQHDNVFRGIVFCAACGKRMSLSHQQIKKDGKTVENRPLYRCKTHYGNNPEDCPRNNFIYYTDIYEQITIAVRKVILLLRDDCTAFGAAQKKIAEQNNRKKAEAEKDRIEKRLNGLQTIIRKLYEDYLAQVLDEENYRGLLANYQNEQRSLNERLTVVNGELESSDDYGTRMQKLKMLAAAYESESLTAEMLNQLIERIEISTERNDDGIDHKINIIYRFINSNI